jgi:acyl carrier protein
VSDVAQKVIEVIAKCEYLPVDEVRPKSHLVNDIGVDSLSAIELVLAIEEAFEIDIPDDDAERIETVQQAIDYVEARVGKQVSDETIHPVITTFAEYRERASRTDADMPLEYYALGLAGEAGETVDAVKKYLYHQREDCREKSIEELGDLCWFADRLAAKLGVTLEHVTSKNATKLLRRYPHGWDIEQASKRNDDENSNE